MTELSYGKLFSFDLSDIIAVFFITYAFIERLLRNIHVDQFHSERLVIGLLVLFAFAFALEWVYAQFVAAAYRRDRNGPAATLLHKRGVAGILIFFWLLRRVVIIVTASYVKPEVLAAVWFILANCAIFVLVKLIIASDRLRPRILG